MHRVGFWVCTTLVFANMVGTGVFTSLGFQAAVLPSPFALIFLWVLGGIVALCGALSYAELAAALPRSGGEYHFLGRIFHPSLGVMGGFVSVFVGFAAPIALAAMAFGKYIAAALPGIHSAVASIAVVLILAAIHAVALRVSGVVQVAATFLKVSLIVTFIIAGCWLAQGVNLWPHPGDWRLIASAPFAISLMFVMYSYSGWNAAVYIAGEVKSPERIVPAALTTATLAVTLLYVALNAVFLSSAPISEFAGKVAVGEVSARHLFGAGGGRIMSGVIAVGLISSLSALTWAGPRVAQTAGEDFSALRWFAVRTRGGIPLRALALQTGVVIVLLLTSSFEAVLVYAQFALIACSCLTVLGLLVLRRREPTLARPFKCPCYPIVPGLFLTVSFFTLGYTILSKPLEAGAGILTLCCGLGLYFLIRNNGSSLPK